MPRAEGSAESDVPLGPAAYSLSWNGLRCFSTKTRFSRKGPALGADSSRAWFRPVRSFPGEEHILLHPPFEEQRRHTRGSLPAVLEQPAGPAPQRLTGGAAAVQSRHVCRAPHTTARVGRTCHAQCRAHRHDVPRRAHCRVRRQDVPAAVLGTERCWGAGKSSPFTAFSGPRRGECARSRRSRLAFLST